MRINRRSLLRGTAGIGVAAVSGIGSAACSSSGVKSSGAEQNRKVTLPAYVPYESVKPDYSPTAAGVEAGYVNYPAERKKLYEAPPGAGKDVTALAIIGSVVPPPVTSNSYWQELNNRLNANLKFNWAPTGDYKSKLTVVVAGGDLPDYLQIRVAIGDLAQTPQALKALKAKCADLTEFLAGDKIKNYPALGNITPRSWQSCLFNGGIYAIPVQSSTMIVTTFTREDLLAERGLSSQVTSSHEFLELCKALTDAKKNKWATAAPLNLLYNIQEVFDTPNRWQQTEGRFQCEFESDGMKRCLDFMNQMFKAGVFHPDSFGSTATDKVKVWFDNGTISLFNTGSTGYLSYMKNGRKLNPKYDVGAIAPYDADGSAGRTFSGPNIFSITALKKASKARIEELLRIADYLAAPFGTDEHLFRAYGVDGTHFRFEGANPVDIEGKTTERGLPVGYICKPPTVLYSPEFPERVKEQHEFETNALKNVKNNDAVGLYSDANASLWPTLNKNMQNVQNDIIQGRASLSEWDDAVKKFRADGGDKIRAELEGAYADTHG